jgi:hypothetical protein
MIIAFKRKNNIKLKYYVKESKTIQKQEALIPKRRKPSK